MLSKLKKRLKFFSLLNSDISMTFLIVLSKEENRSFISMKITLNNH